MVVRSSLFICVLVILAFIYSSKAYLNPNGVNVCLRIVSYSQIYRQSYQYSRVVSYTTKCGFWNMKRCTRYRTVYGTMYRDKTRKVYKPQYQCCNGWAQVGNQCSQPICLQPCVHGICTLPDYCSCKSGYHGIQCNRDCPSHKWGPQCHHDCLCQNNSTCSPHSGNCTCAQGWQGQYCNKSCDHGHYGVNCQNQCQCQNGSQCDVITGKCTCAVGYTGTRCDQQCSNGFYGQNCALKCTCTKGICDHVNGSCECSVVSQGENCDKISVCDSCLHGGWCDLKTGSCNCTEGWIGKKCDQKCPRGTYGHFCAHKCSSHCKEDASCNHVTGNCDCRPGYSGERCDNRCRCKNNSTCSPINGSCECNPGYTGKHCELCADGQDCRKIYQETQSDPNSDGKEENVALPIILSVIPLITLIAIAIGCFVRYKRSKRMCENDTSDNYAEVTETTTTSPTITAVMSSSEERIYQLPSSDSSITIRNNSTESRHYDEPIAHSVITTQNHYDEPIAHSAITTQNHIYDTPSIKYVRAIAHDCDDESVTTATEIYMQLQNPRSPNIYEPMSYATKNRTGLSVLLSEHSTPNVRNANNNDDDDNADDNSESTKYQQLKNNEYEHLHDSTRHPLS